MPADAIITPPGGGTENHAFGLTRRFRISPEDTGGAFCLFEEEIPEGAGPPLHIHLTEIEVFTVLEGNVRFHCDGKEADAGPGYSIMIPMGSRHAFKGLGPGTARVLIMLSPGQGEGFFRDVEAEGLRPPEGMDRINEIAARYGVEFVGPPLD